MEMSMAARSQLPIIIVLAVYFLLYNLGKFRANIVAINSKFKSNVVLNEFGFAVKRIHRNVSQRRIRAKQLFDKHLKIRNESPIPGYFL